MSIDTIGNFLTIIRNGIHASKSFVVAPHSKFNFEIARILKEEGFIRDVLLLEEDPVRKKIKVFLKYVSGESVIHNIKRASRPGLRLYRGANAVAPVIGGLGLSVLTTNKGVMSHKRAAQLSVGGEVICTVW